MTEKELTSPVSLTLEDGTLNPAAHGWARQPIVDTSGIGRTHLGKNKRWEYWCILTPTHIIAFTIASLDFVAVNDVWVFDRTTLKVIEDEGAGFGEGAGAGCILPGSVESGPARGVLADVRVDIDQTPTGTRLRVVTPEVGWDIMASKPEGHERLAVTVPWSDQVFQYTVKDVARPAKGFLEIGGKFIDVPEGSWAILDHGRGRWPSDIAWNWGAGAGKLDDGRVIGIQVGAKWTEGTGSTENAMTIGTKLFKISEELKWEYDTKDFLKPWRISGGGLDATLTPFYDKFTDKGSTEEMFMNKTHQCFGYWSGSFDNGTEVVKFKEVIGFAEDTHRRW